MADKKRITVIGGGVGGYTAAIKAARMGAAVHLIERDLLGGTCLNRGCIPTKALLQAAEVVQIISEAPLFGIRCDAYSIDFKAVTKRKDKVVKQLRQGVTTLLKRRRIKIVTGTALFRDSATVEIKETGEKTKSDNIIITSGSKPGRISFEGSDGPDVLDSDQVLELTELPQSLVIIGGGVVGVEFAQIFKRLGADVTLLEITDTLIPGADRDIAQALAKSLSDAGIEVVTEAAVKKISRRQGQNEVTFKHADNLKRIAVEKVVLAVGRKPDTAGLGLDCIGLKHNSGTLTVNDRLQTNIPHIFAAGDAVGGLMLAHKAMAEGERAVTAIMDGNPGARPQEIPSCIYTSPEVASVGLTEAQAARSHDIEAVRYPFAACAKALLMNRTFGMVKIVADKKFGQVLGVHIIGPHATDMIAEAVLGMSLEMTVDELAHAVHPHPTLSEAVMEAGQMFCGGAAHLP
jgi:dihydrolipoamide dehydrogenase